MSTIYTYTCDRCKKTTNSRSFWLSISVDRSLDGKTYFDLCQDCHKSFNHFLAEFCPKNIHLRTFFSDLFKK